jgi:hypothetical protein
MNNGRVYLGNKGTTLLPTKVPGFDYRTKTAESEADDAIRGNVVATPLNRAFFSPANVRIVQNRLRREVYDRSNGDFLIDDQSVDDLLIVMRAMYLQYGRNHPDDIPGQINELNRIVADWAVPKILAECSMHRTYLHDIQNLPVPLAQPVHLSSKGSKSSSFDRFF